MKPYLSVKVWQKKINFFEIGQKNLDPIYRAREHKYRFVLAKASITK